MSKRRNEESGKDYEVGYARPPKMSQFQKGQSGNPRGRQKGQTKSASAPETVSALISKESARIVRGTENGRQFEGPAFQVIIRQLYNKALNGNFPAIKQVLHIHETSISNSPAIPDSEDLAKMDAVQLMKLYTEFVSSTTPTPC
ncbi:MAG: hypothetical protein JWL66_1679 [Sphingomonadales bacterium]|nr:hypothetical protein [Sphingomonadales bacterium]